MSGPTCCSSKRNVRLRVTVYAGQRKKESMISQAGSNCNPHLTTIIITIIGNNTAAA